MRKLPGALLPGSPPDAGFEQTLADDLRFLIRFGRCRRIATAWRTPTPAERGAHDAHPIVGRFGDETCAVAEVAGRQWIVRERDWHGWPGPPRYVFFALAGDAVWAARDFARWPAAWVPAR